jgi:outer membrane autotransporter protein
LINIANGATLDLSAGNGTQVVGAIEGAGTVNIGALVTGIGGAGNDTFSGGITGTGSVVKIGTGTATLTGQNTYTGGTVVQAGTLALGGAGNLAANGALTLHNDGSTFDISGANGPTTVGALSADSGTQIQLGSNTLTFGDATSHSVAAIIGGSGGIVKQGSGTTTLHGLQQYTGTTTIADGTLAIGATGSLGGGATVALSGPGAVFDVSGAGNQSLGHLSGTGGRVVLGNGSTLQVGNNDNATLASAISGTGALIMDGSGRLTLGGVNTFTGNVGVNSGTLALGAGGTLSNANDVTLASGATFDVSAATAPVIGSLNGAAGSTLDAGMQTLTLGSAGNGTFTGTLNGTGGLIKQGSGTQMLDSGAALTGNVRIDAGTLALSNTTRLNGNAVNLNGATGVLDLSSGPNQTVASIAGISGSAINLGNATLTLADAGGNALASDIHGADGGLVKLGNGVQTLAGNSDFGGGVDVQAGGIAVSSNTALGTGNVRFADGTSLDATQTGTLGNQITLDGNLTVAGSNDLTLNGAIGGAGGITKNGAATLTLNGQNTYSGATNVNAGTLALGAGASLADAGVVNVQTGAMFDLSAGNGTQTFGALTGGGAVNMGGNTLEVGTSGLDDIYSGGVMGAGSLVKVGTGTETMTGANTFTGGTVVQAGTLALSGAGTLAASGAVTLQNAGTTLDISGADGSRTIGALTTQAGTNVTLGSNTLTFGDASSHTVSGTITGAGGIVKTGEGTQTLTGQNTFSGTTTVTGGTLALGASGQIGHSTGLALRNAGSKFDASASATPLTFASLEADTGTQLVLGSGGLLTGDNGNHTFDGTLSGAGGLVKNGSGTLTLGGQNPLTGPTTVAGGTLSIGGLPNSPVTVQAGATLTTPAPVPSGSSGTGAQTGALTGASGSQIVVASPGSTLGVNGNLTLQPGSTLQVSAAPGIAPSQVDASGSASIGGSHLVVNAAPDTQPADASGAVIVSAPGGVSGQFASASTNLLYLTPQVSYTPTSVLLTFAPNGTPLSAGAVTPNQQAVAGAVSALGNGSALYQAALGLSAATAPAAFQSLDGSLYASVTSMLLSQTQMARDAVSQRLRESLSLAQDCDVASPDDREASTHPAQIDRSSDCRTQPRATQAWASVYGNDGQMRGKPVADGGSGASTLHRRGMGVLAGVDVPLADAWRAGGFGGLGHSTFNTGPGASGNSNDAQIGAYVNRRFGHLGATIGGAYGWQQITSQRGVAVGPIAQTARGSYNASVWQVFGEAAWRLDAGPASIEPFANVAYARVRTDAFDETGSIAALHADEQAQGITFSTAGLRGEMAFGTGSAASGRLRLSAGWRHAYGANTPDMRLAFSGTSAAFTVGGIPIARDAAVVSAGVDAFIGTALTLGVSYSGQFGGQVSDNTLYGNLNWRF